MLKTITVSLALFTAFADVALACGPKPPEQSIMQAAEIANAVAGQSLECNYNGIVSEGKLTVAVPRCMNGTPRITLRAFGESIRVTELTRSKNTLTAISPDIDWPINCHIK